MKLKIWSVEEAKNSKEGQLFVILEPCSELQDIHLVVVDKKCNRIDHGHLVMLDQDLKCLIILNHVSEDIPLKTDIDGSLLFLRQEEYQQRKEKELHNEFVYKIIKSIHEDEKDYEPTH